MLVSLRLQCALCFSRRFQSLTGQETICLGNGNHVATSADLESWKQELLSEVRREIQTVKLEIIEGECLILCSVYTMCICVVCTVCVYVCAEFYVAIVFS